MRHEDHGAILDRDATVPDHQGHSGEVAQTRIGPSFDDENIGELAGRQKTRPKQRISEAPCSRSEQY